MDIKSLLVGEAIAGGGDTPTGKLEITTTSEVNVASYAKAQVVDADLIAGNIKKDVDILGITGTYEPTPIQPNLTDLEATSNGTYTHTGYDGYDEVVVNVANSYVAGDEGKVVSNGALVSQSSTTKNANGTYDTTLNNSITVAVPQPSGNINITDMNSTNVANYATAQVVDADLVAGNIKKDVNILGVTGTYEGSGSLPTTISLDAEAAYLNNNGYWNWVFQNGMTLNVNNSSCNLTGAFQNVGTGYTDGQWNKVIVNSNNQQMAPSLNMQNFMKNCAYATKPVALSGNFTITNANYMFGYCQRMQFPSTYFDNCDFTYCSDYSNMFIQCYGLRELPDLTNLNLKGTQTATQNGKQFISGGAIGGCYCLNKAVNLPLPKNTITHTRSIFGNQSGLWRISEFTFATDNGTPYQISTSANQVLEIAAYVGYCDYGQTDKLAYGGISQDKQVTDLASYNLLKDDPDWWTTDAAFSRYNHDSAVHTINSLPTITGGGTAEIRFLAEAGSGYGKGISTLTSAEIAVATAKGWTVNILT